MKLAPIESQQRLYVRVAQRIAELVANGEVKPGEKLPAERRLAEMLQVSRPTIREAMIALEVSGLIDVRTGSGIYVTQQGHRQRVTLDDEGIGPFELLELRLILEPEASALAAERITDAQLAALQDIFEEMRKFAGTPRIEEVDARFHVAIAEATENAAITQAVQWLWTLRNQSVLSSGFHSRILEEGIYPAVDQHKEILDALKVRSADAARKAMRAHLIAATEAAARHFGSEP
ncbi:MAG: FadR/GntR family transcriptional regulator [Gammaproteobacteria bacterium]|nr:FadR/GntR family transcriptional regulator [Gammaproteobacteria bacterium]